MEALALQHVVAFLPNLPQIMIAHDFDRATHFKAAKEEHDFVQIHLIV